MSKLRTCRACRRSLPLSEFHFYAAKNFKGEATGARRPQPRCKKCHSAWRWKTEKARRETVRQRDIENNDEHERRGFRRCTKCFKLKHLSEFGTRYSRRQGKVHKICDRCLTPVLKRNATPDFGYRYWRRRAYAANTAGLARLRRLQPEKKLTFSDLQFECKPQDLMSLFDQQDGKCFYCQADLDTTRTENDHMLPLSRGGKHELSNIVIACGDCNQLKGNRTVREFLTFVREYRTRSFRAAELLDKEPVG